MYGNYSVPLFNKEGLGEILLDKSPSVPIFQRGGVNIYNVCVIPSRMGRDIFLTCFFYPYLIPNGILANGFVIVHSQKCPALSW